MSFDKSPAATPILPTAQSRKVKATEPARPLKFSDFEIMQTLGEGSFGKVFKVKKKSTGVIYAMKSMSKKQLIDNS